MVKRTSMDNMAVQLEDIAKDITGTPIAKGGYAWDIIDNAVTTIANAVGAVIPSKKYNTKKERVAALVNAIAEADVSGGSTPKLSDLIVTSGITGTLQVKDGITDIGDQQYASCTGVTQVIIPNTVTTIGHAAFGSLGAAVKTTEKGTFDFEHTGVTTINAFAFGGALLLKSIKLDNCTFIDDGGFSGCSNLQSVVLPAIVSFGTPTAVFGGCAKCSYIYLGPDCKDIPAGAFAGVPITCKVECGFAEGDVEGFPANAGFAGDIANLDITYNVLAPTI